MMEMCIYKGCPWKSKLVNLNNHIQKCLFNTTKLPKFMKITNWLKVKENIDKRNKNKEEEENNTIENLCSFNYTSSIKERIFSRNPNLVLKIFDKEKNKENIQ